MILIGRRRLQNEQHLASAAAATPISCSPQLNSWGAHANAAAGTPPPVSSVHSYANLTLELEAPAHHTAQHRCTAMRLSIQWFCGSASEAFVLLEVTGRGHECHSRRSGSEQGSIQSPNGLDRHIDVMVAAAKLLSAVG